ncbi:hypothetical protein Tco_0525962 [Tanacetum coccineum]
MNTTQDQQKALDDALVAPADRLEFGKCNMRLKTDIKPKEATFQVVLDALALTPFYQAFLITAEVPAIYMQEFWATVTVHKLSIRFTLNKKKFSLDVKVFREILQICPKILGQRFEEPPLEHDILSFLRDLRNTRAWRAFATIIKKCLSGKDTAYEKIRLSHAKILWGMYNNKNIDYVYLLWEDFLFQSISRRNKMFWHTTRDDTMFTSMRCVSRHEKTQVYSAILPQHLTNQAMVESIAYQTYYAYATGEKDPKEKYVRKKAESDTSLKKKTAPTIKGSRLKSLAKVAKTNKKKQPATMPKTKGLAVLSEVALTEAEQIKLATKRSKKNFHMSQASGLGDEVDIQSKLPDEQQQKVTGTNEGAGVRPEVPNVPNDDSESEEESWTFSQDDDDAEEKTVMNDDSEENESDNDGDDFTHPSLSTYKADDQEEKDEKADDKEVFSNQSMSTPPDYELTDEEENKEGDDMNNKGEQEQDEEDYMYGDVNINLERSDAEMTDAQANKDTEDAHVTLTAEPPVSHTLVNLPASVAAETPYFDTTIPQPPIPNTLPLQQTQYSTITTTNPIMTLPEIPNFASVFRFDQRVSALETEMLMLKSPRSCQRLTNMSQNLWELKFTLKRGQDDKDKDEEPSAGSNRGSKRRRLGKEAESSKEPTHKESKSTTSSKGASRSQPKSSSKSAHAKEHGQKARDDVVCQWNPSSSPTPDREWHKTKTVDNRPPQPWITQLAQAAGTQSSFNKFLATPIDFSAFIINRLKIDNLTQEVLTGPTYDLIKGTCKNVMELEYHLEEVFKATNDQLDLHNPKGRSYASNMESSYDVYSRNRIIAVTSLKIMKWYGYSHLEEIIVRRHDDKLYKFREGDFKRLHRQDIEDMLLLLVQDKLTNLNLEERYALNVALRMFTRRIVIQEHVEDLQQGVESNQKKINLQRPDSYHLDLRRMTAYTAYHDIQGIIYKDELNRKCLMCIDELHKFNDGTLNYVHTALSDID